MEVLALLPHANKLVNAIRLDDPLPVSCISQDRLNEVATPTCLDDFKSYIKEVGGDYHESVCPLPPHQLLNHSRRTRTPDPQDHHMDRSLPSEHSRPRYRWRNRRSSGPDPAMGHRRSYTSRLLRPQIGLRLE